MKRAFGKKIEWVEPNVRSTVSVGVPDCKLTVGDEVIPVELKFGKFVKNAFKLEMRPPQIRYHIMSARKGKKTAILFGIPFVGSEEEFMIYIIPGVNCPQDKYLDGGTWQVGTSVTLVSDLAKQINKIMRSAEFWESK